MEARTPSRAGAARPSLPERRRIGFSLQTQFFHPSLVVKFLFRRNADARARHDATTEGTAALARPAPFRLISGFSCYRQVSWRARWLASAAPVPLLRRATKQAPPALVLAWHLGRSGAETRPKPAGEIARFGP